METLGQYFDAIAASLSLSPKTLAWLESVGGIVFDVAILLLAAFLLMRFRAGAIEKIFNVTRVSQHKRKTLHSLLMSLTKYTIYTLAILSILDVLTVPIVPLLAGAGLASIAVGLGAQSIIKDVITGFFIIFEDQYRVGEYININDNVTGTVEELGLRLTTLRLWTGQKFFIANSEIKTVSNYNRGSLRSTVSVVFPYEVCPEDARNLLEEVCAEIRDEYREHLLSNSSGEPVEPPRIYGVTDIEENQRGGKFTITTLGKNESFFLLERAIREKVWGKSRERGIAIAYPQHIIDKKDSPHVQPAPGE